MIKVWRVRIGDNMETLDIVATDIKEAIDKALNRTIAPKKQEHITKVELLTKAEK